MTTLLRGKLKKKKKRAQFKFKIPACVDITDFETTVFT